MLVIYHHHHQHVWHRVVPERRPPGRWPLRCRRPPLQRWHPPRHWFWRMLLVSIRTVRIGILIWKMSMILTWLEPVRNDYSMIYVIWNCNLNNNYHYHAVPYRIPLLRILLRTTAFHSHNDYRSVTFLPDEQQHQQSPPRPWKCTTRTSMTMRRMTLTKTKREHIIIIIIMVVYQHLEKDYGWWNINFPIIKIEWEGHWNYPHPRCIGIITTTTTIIVLHDRCFIAMEVPPRIVTTTMMRIMVNKIYMMTNYIIGIKIFVPF